MPKLLTNCDKALKSGVQRSSKHTDPTHSTSSINYFTLKDNDILSNKKLFIHYGNEKRDLKLEDVLKRLNSEILEYFDDAVHFVITATKRIKKIENNTISTNNKSTFNVGAINSRARKLIGLVQEKNSKLGVSKNNNGNAKDFWDIISEKGIRVIHLQSVWNWLHENHALLLQMILFEKENFDPNGEINETRDTHNEVKTLIHPSLKILDVANETRPTSHSKCHFQMQMFEETFVDNNDKEQLSGVSKSKVGGLCRRASIRSTKVTKRNNKSTGGYCESCSVTYTDVISHLESNSHKTFGNNDENFKGIDQVISNISEMNPFLSIRIRKQKILDKRKSCNQLIKSMSANDFKNERKEVHQKSISFTTVGSTLIKDAVPPPRHGNIEYIIEEYEEILFTPDVCEYNISYVETLKDQMEEQVCVSRRKYNVIVEEVGMAEESAQDIKDMVSMRPNITVQENNFNMVTIQQQTLFSNTQIFDSWENNYFKFSTVESVDIIKSTKCSPLQYAAPLIRPIIYSSSFDLTRNDNSHDNDNSCHNNNLCHNDNSRDNDISLNSLSLNDSSFCNEVCWNLSPPINILSPRNNQHGQFRRTPPLLINDHYSAMRSPIHIHSPICFDDLNTQVHLKDSIINLKQYVFRNNTEYSTETISKKSLYRNKTECNLDKYVSDYFQKKIQLDFTSSIKCLREITNISKESLVYKNPEDSSNKSCRRVKHVPQNSISPTNNNNSYISPLVYRNTEDSSSNRLCRKSKTAARHSIKMTNINNSYKEPSLYRNSIDSSSPNRLNRKAKTVARNSINLITNLLSN